MLQHTTEELDVLFASLPHKKVSKKVDHSWMKKKDNEWLSH
jgi:hypothetical protein